MSQDPTLEVLFEDAANIVARHAGALIQVRKAELTMDALESMVRLAHAERVRRGGSLPFLAVVEEGAPTTTGLVRERQREMLAELGRDARTLMATVTIGDTIAASLHRTMARGFARQGTTVCAAPTVPEAIRWLSERDPSIDAVSLSKAVEALRAQLAAR